MVSFAIDSMGLRTLQGRGSAKAAGTRGGDARGHKGKKVMWSKYAPTATALVVTAAIARECVPAFRLEGGVRTRIQTKSASVLSAQANDWLPIAAFAQRLPFDGRHSVVERRRREGFSS